MTELLGEDQLVPAARAAALDSAGLLLARRPGLVLSDLWRQSNFTAFPAWVIALTRSTL